MSIDEKPLCQECGQNPVMHRGSPDMCCKCHVANGNPPADWHPECVAAYEAAKAKDQPVDCRSAFHKWMQNDCWDSVAQEFYACWEAAWNARPMREIVEAVNTSDLAAEVNRAFSNNAATGNLDKAAAVRQALNWVALRYNITPKPNINLRSGEKL